MIHLLNNYVHLLTDNYQTVIAPVCSGTDKFVFDYSERAAIFTNAFYVSQKVFGFVASFVCLKVLQTKAAQKLKESAPLSDDI